MLADGGVLRTQRAARSAARSRSRDAGHVTSRQTGGVSLLSPYRVLDLTDDRGHLAGHMLAMLGADVIAIEPPEGQRARRVGPFAGDVEDPERSLEHWAFNRGKRSVVLDLETEEGRATLRELAAGADVVFEAGWPGDAAARGYGYEDLAAVNPALVYVAMSPFGQTGPKADWRGEDLVTYAAGCTLALTGDEDRAPVRITVPQSWFHAAGDAAGAALIALWERHTSGLGQFVDISVQTSVMQATQSMVLAAPLGSPPTMRMAGGAKLPPLDLQLVWPCKDGHVTISFLFGTSIGPYTARLMAWLHEEGFCDDATFAKDWIQFAMQVHEGTETVAEFERIKRCVDAFCLTKTKAELLERAMRERMLIAPVTTVEDVAHSEQLEARDYWQDVVVPQADDATVRFPGATTRFSRTPLEPLGPPPRLGEHTDAVLAEARRSPAVVPDVSAPAGDAADGTAAVAEGSAPLAGVKVLDLMWAMAGPAATRVLADYGATVVRVESEHKLEVARGLNPFLGGEPGAERSGLFLNMNAGKLGLALDMSNPEARDVILDLVRWCDVLCESFSPRAMASWGLDYETLREVNPRLIMVSSCLMGQTGPMRLFAGFGNLAAAISGFHQITGWADRHPSGPFSAYTDYVAPRFTVAAIMAALEERRRSGQGQYLDFSQGEASIHLLSTALLDYGVNGRVAERRGNDDRLLAPHGVYPTRGEDRWVAIAIEDDAQWRTLADELGRADLAGLDAGERMARRRELDELLTAWTADQDEVELQDHLQAVGVPAHAVQNSAECWADPQLAHRGHFVEVDHAMNGPVVVEGTRFAFSRTPPPGYRAAPTLGQDAFEVLTELLGYDVDKVADLAAAELLE